MVTTSIYDIADEFATLTTRSFFLTGKAGTGKTTFLKQLRESCRKQIAVVAPTGVAAINAGGVTIHSFFQLPITPFVPTPEGRINLIKKMKMSGRKRKVLQELELLVIDEISMVRADVLDEIDTVLRHYRFREHEPFGGVQVICIGDLYQLAPVAVPEEWNVLASFYRTPYFFDSHVIQQHPLLYVEFDKIFRQSDASFIRILNAVRNDKLNDRDLTLLQKQYDPTFDISKHPDYILLTTHNYKADRVNNSEMARLKNPDFAFNAEIKGDFPEKSFPNNAKLRLKKGAKVMFIANDTDTPRKYFNGKIGTIVEISKEKICVRCDDSEDIIEVKQEIWKNIRYSVNPVNKQIEEEELGTFKQYPLRLAWAITIHKSQGLTFDKVAIDIEAAFTSGQVYVALSRCRSLDGIALLSPLNRYSLTVDQNVVSYTSHGELPKELLTQLDHDKAHYNEKIVLDIFNFSFCCGLANQLHQFVGQEKNLFNVKTQTFLNNLKSDLQHIAIVGGKFQHQLQSIYINQDKETLNQRIDAASIYFTDELNNIIELLVTSPASIEDYENADEYNFCLQSLYDELTRKQHIIKNIRKDYSTEHCLELKETHRASKLNLNAYMPRRKKSSSKKTVKIEKAPKTSTFEQTFQLYKKGKSPVEIASERGFALSTIEDHIARLIKEGKISIYDFVTKEQLEATREFIVAGGGLKDIFDALEGNVSFGQLRMMKAAIEKDGLQPALKRPNQQSTTND